MTPSCLPECTDVLDILSGQAGHEQDGWHHVACHIGPIIVTPTPVTHTDEDYIPVLYIVTTHSAQ